MSAVIMPRYVGANMIEMQYPDETLVLFSYKAPVAAWIRGPDRFLRTATKHSNTTGRHIAKWFRLFGVANPQLIPQEYIDALASCSPKVWALRDAIKELGA